MKIRKLSVFLSLALLLAAALPAQTVSPNSLTQNAVQTLIQQNEGQAAQQNSQALASLTLACSNWTSTNIQNRALALPLTVKPAQPLAAHVLSTIAPGGLSFTLAWSFGPDLVGKPCADLPSNKLPANNMQLGNIIAATSMGTYYQVGPQDTIAPGQPVTQNGHTYIKLQSPGAMVTNADGSVPGWYLQIN